MTLIPTRSFWISTHRYVGLATLLFLAVAAITGCLLCFRAPLDAALNPDLFEAASVAPAAPIVAVRAFEAAHPTIRVLSFPLHVAPGLNLAASVGPADGGTLDDDQAFMGAADGHLVGMRATRPGWGRRQFLQGVYTLHFTLLAGTVGRWFMGVVAIGWLIGAIVGLYLTLPSRPPYLKPWLKAWRVRIKSRLPRLMLDLHQATSLWLFIGLFGLAATSVCLNFFDEAFQPAVLAISPARPSPFDSAAKPEQAARRIDFGQALNAGLAHARGAGTTWRPASLSYDPRLNLYGVTFTRSGVVNYSGLGPVTDYVSAADGHFVFEDSPYADSVGRKLTRVLYPLHTGQIIGPIGIAFIFIVGLQTVELCITGAYVWWVRRPSRVAFRKARRQAQRQAT